MNQILYYSELAWKWFFDNIFYINIIFAIIIVFFERKEPKTVWAWLLVMFAIPIAGFVLYLVVGQDYHKTKMFRTKEIEDELNGAIKQQEDNIYRNEFDTIHSKHENYRDLVLYNLHTSSAFCSNDNSVEIFNDGTEKFNDLIREIQKANRFIHIQYYIIRTDELFNAIAEELVKKAREGVQVRVLYDGLGGRHFKPKQIRYLRKNGVLVGVFFPAMFGMFQMRINYRNHRKIAVIDGRVGYVGGFNIGKEYLGKDKKFGYWRDTHLKIEGSAVNDLQVRFMLDWNYATKENLFRKDDYFSFPYRKQPGNTPIQIISSGPDKQIQQIRDNYLRIMQKAEKSIYIHTPYFIPDESVLQTLVMAAQSGIDVRLMIPDKPDHPFIYWVNSSYAGDLLGAGAKVYKYENGFLHSKGVMVDGLVSCYGTANMDIRSFALNFEVNAMIYDEEVTRKLESQFIEDISLCREITLHEYSQRNIFVRMKEQICRLLGPLL